MMAVFIHYWSQPDHVIVSFDPHIRLVVDADQKFPAFTNQSQNGFFTRKMRFVWKAMEKRNKDWIKMMKKIYLLTLKEYVIKAVRCMIRTLNQVKAFLIWLFTSWTPNVYRQIYWHLEGLPLILEPREQDCCHCKNVFSGPCEITS